jgi:hypothetical protein
MEFEHNKIALDARDAESGMEMIKMLFGRIILLLATLVLLIPHNGCEAIAFNNAERFIAVCLSGVNK